jgi:hypothetical protein
VPRPAEVVQSLQAAHSNRHKPSHLPACRGRSPHAVPVRAKPLAVATSNGLSVVDIHVKVTLHASSVYDRYYLRAHRDGPYRIVHIQSAPRQPNGKPVNHTGDVTTSGEASIDSGEARISMDPFGPAVCPIIKFAEVMLNQNCKCPAGEEESRARKSPSYIISVFQL